MSSKQLLESLDILDKHSDIQEYIKSFDDPQEFINTINTNIYTDMVKQIENLLDPQGMYTGGMWVLLLSNIHKALKGVITREYILTQITEEKCKKDELDWELHYLEIKRRQEMASSARPN